jgi:hypothetical protein
MFTEVETMANFTPSKPPDPIKISVWKGVNEAVGLTGLELGETLRQVNFRITKDYKLEEREGHNTFIDFENTNNVQGIWEGQLGGVHVLIACNNGHVYKILLDSEFTKTKISELITDGNAFDVGTLTDAKTSMLYFESKLLFWNGTDYKEYDGTTFQNVPPYVPTGWKALNPDMSDFTTANVYEQRNCLTGEIKAEYQGNGTSTIYQLPETNIDAALTSITVDGAIKTELTHYTVDRTAGTINWGAGTSPFGAPASASLVIPKWTKVTAGQADLVKKNKHCMTFGPGNDTSIFLWGGEQINRRCWCAALNYKYWPVNNETYIGTNEYAITDIKAQNANYMIVFEQNRTHYSVPELITLPTGQTAYDYPVYDLNESVGNNTFGAVRLIGDNAISMDSNSWWKWEVGAVESQRSAKIFSERLEQSLSITDLSKAVTFDCQAKKEYWCNVDSVVYIWNYGNNTMYTFENISGTCYLDIGGVVHYGSQGTIERLQGLNDNGVEVVPQADTGFYPFGGINLLKSSDIVYVGLLPDSKTSLTIYFKTNKITEWKKIRKVAKYSLLDFDNIDFDNFTFLTNRNPQTFALEFSSNDYVYIQFRLENAELNETCTVLDFLVQAEVQGEV